MYTQTAWSIRLTEIVINTYLHRLMIYEHSIHTWIQKVMIHLHSICTCIARLMIHVRILCTLKFPSLQKFFFIVHLMCFMFQMILKFFDIFLKMKDLTSSEAFLVIQLIHVCIISQMTSRGHRFIMIMPHCFV